MKKRTIIISAIVIAALILGGLLTERSGLFQGYIKLPKTQNTGVSQNVPKAKKIEGAGQDVLGYNTKKFSSTDIESLKKNGVPPNYANNLVSKFGFVNQIVILYEKGVPESYANTIDSRFSVISIGSLYEAIKGGIPVQYVNATPKNCNANQIKKGWKDGKGALSLVCS